MPSSEALFVTFEGGEGCGKSTQIKILVSSLLQKKVDVVSYREPGGTEGAEEIRKLVLFGRNYQWCPQTEALLMSAARADLVHKRILPDLKQGKCVLCDRFNDSTLAYQGFGHGLGYDSIDTLNRFTVGSLTPDLTFVFLLDPKISQERVKERQQGEDHFESFDLSFHRRVQQGYQEIIRRNPKRCVRVDATLPKEKIADLLLSEITQRFPFLFLSQPENN